MGQSLFQKVWDSHSVRTLPSGQTQLFIGLHLIHEAIVKVDLMRDIFHVADFITDYRVGIPNPDFVMGRKCKI